MKRVSIKPGLKKDILRWRYFEKTFYNRDSTAEYYRKTHLGHVLDTTFTRYRCPEKECRAMMYCICPVWILQSSATQTKVEAELRKEGISRYDLGREKFLEKVWEWKEYYSSLIREQWAVIGLSLDYTRERFTLDEGLNKAVNEVFIRMYNEGLIYRGDRIINWDVQSKTALSNVEVIYEDIEGAFYSILYPFVEGEGGLVTDNETGNNVRRRCLMVHPEPERYRNIYQ